MNTAKFLKTEHQRWLLLLFPMNKGIRYYNGELEIFLYLLIHLKIINEITSEASLLHFRVCISSQKVKTNYVTKIKCGGTSTKFLTTFKCQRVSLPYVHNVSSSFIQPTHFWLNYAAGKLTFTKKAQIRDNHFTIGTWTLFSQRTWKKSNLVSRNRSSERFLSLTRPHCGMYIRIYICLKKTNIHTHKAKQKKLKKKREKQKKPKKKRRQEMLLLWTVSVGN